MSSPNLTCQSPWRTYHLSESLHGQALLSGEYHAESPPSTITDRTKDGYLTPSVSGIFEVAHFQKRKTFG